MYNIRHYLEKKYNYSINFFGKLTMSKLLSFPSSGLTFAQRQVTVQEGPLYRTENSHITIWCKVSGYQGPAEQNFQWSIYLPSAPEREVQIVSTMDPSFPYAIYTQRVRSGEIYVERVQGDSALLHITELQDRDAGEYECHTPTTDERYFGSYSAKMKLVGKVVLLFQSFFILFWGFLLFEHVKKKITEK